MEINANPEKLIITAACDCSSSFPYMEYREPCENIKFYADEYVRCANAGATMLHIHGVRTIDPEIQPDGRKLSTINVPAWQELKDRIESGISTAVKPMIQYGIAGARLPQKVELMKQGPDLMSFAFSAHDEYFWPDPTKAPTQILAVHPRQELQEFCSACNDNGVKPEVECFQMGAYFNANTLRDTGYISKKEHIYSTVFVGWPGGAWTPCTISAMKAMVDNRPAYTNWNVSCMDYDPLVNWQVLTAAILMGGHVRVGWEDNPYVDRDTLARSNAELVEKIAKIARLVGREIASPEEARAIVFRKTETEVMGNWKFQGRDNWRHN